jgi:hypothetical protein
MKLRQTLLSAAALIASASYAYDLRTHAILVEKSYERSVLWTDAERLLKSLGLWNQRIPGTNHPKLRDGYHDFKLYAERDVRRGSSPFEDGILNKEGDFSAKMLSAQAWMMRGAIREDDGSTVVNIPLKLFTSRYGPDPEDDPDGTFSRFCGHFFDPYRNHGLWPNLGANAGGNEAMTVVGCDSVGERSVTWAIGAEDPFATMLRAARAYQNHFTIYSAREAQWRALTLTQKQDAGGYAVLQNIARAQPDAKQREQLLYWTTLFRSLGHVVHLVQDASQPQHSRNEGHGKFHANNLEAYLDARANRDARFTFAHKEAISSGTYTREFASTSFAFLIASTYPIVQFPSYADYWTTARGQAPRGDALTVGRGISDYANRGFLTATYVIGNNALPEPHPDPVHPATSR